MTDILSDDAALKLADESIAGEFVHRIEYEQLAYKVKDLLSRQRWIAARAIDIRDALVREDIDDAYHQLYRMVCPKLDSLTPWAEFEKLAISSLPQPSEPKR